MRAGWTYGLIGLALLASSGFKPARGEGPTYHREVVRILQEQCQDCHRPGQVAPFSLLTYEQARKRASDIVTVTGQHKMPPWPASTKEGGPFCDARVLSEAQIATLSEWAEAGAPEGDPKDAPAPRAWTSDWTLGPPDLVLTVPEPYTIGPDGRDEYRVFVLPSGLTEGKWISAIDYKPGNARVVHHILGAFDIRGAARKLDEADPKPGYKAFGGFGIFTSGRLGGWAPGKRARPYPEGVGRYLPAGSDILIQIHYHRSGKTEKDATSIGLYFAKGSIDKQARGEMVLPPVKGLFQRPALSIPAGSANYEVTGSAEIEEDAHLFGITPHMHWLGKDFLLTATRPDGSKTTLIRIDDWDFNWQGIYELVNPVALPKGTRIDMTAHFDNSADNPDNPSSPPVAVHWGEQTNDEMCIGFLHLTFDGEHRKNRPPPRFLGR
jgi:Copper type II ascorbate-dependent monooxygenase, C-terminal domain